MKSTKYQLLKDDYDFISRQLKEYRLLIEQLREKNDKLRGELKRYTSKNKFLNLTKQDWKESNESSESK
jgi:hypothetical protein